MKREQYRYFIQNFRRPRRRVRLGVLGVGSLGDLGREYPHSPPLILPQHSVSSCGSVGPCWDLTKSVPADPPTFFKSLSKLYRESGLSFR